MGRLQKSEEGALEVVLAQADAPETRIDIAISRLDTLLAQWKTEQGQQVPESFSDYAYGWMRMVVQQSRDLIEQEQRDVREYDAKVVNHLRELLAIMSREDQKIRYAPEYVQTLQRLGAQLLFDIEEFV